MTVPIKFRKEQENAIASFDYFDIAGGIGYQRLYCGKASGAILSTEQFYSQPYETTYTESNSFPVLKETITFDTKFNLPQIIKGDAICTLPMQCSGGGNTASANAVFTLQKISDSVTTHIASGAGVVFSSTGSDSKAVTARLNCPLTHFKKDDTMRLSVEVLVGVSAGSGNFAIAYDPKNRTGSGISSIDTMAIADIPFRIDL